MPPLPGPRPETSELRVLTRTEVTDGVVLAVTVEILQTSRPTDELPPPCLVAERAARGVGNRSTRSREIELSEIARDRAGSGGQGGKKRSAQRLLSTCSTCFISRIIAASWTRLRGLHRKKCVCTCACANLRICWNAPTCNKGRHRKDAWKDNE